MPFGTRIDFLAPKTLKERLPVFRPNAVPGIFRGWDMHTGGYWSRDYLVAYLPDFDHVISGERKRVHLCRVRDIPFEPTNIQFPLKDARDKATC